MKNSEIKTDPPVEGYMHSVETFGAVDGPGVRYVLFLQGCPLRCLYCHNPDSWKLTDGKKTDSKRVFDDIMTYYSFIKYGGVTLSGGDPLLQPEFSSDILRRCKVIGLHTAVDTAGFAELEKTIEVLEYTDLLLLDIKALEDELCRKITGQSGERARAILDYCESVSKPVWVRHVIVPGLTLDYEMLAKLAEYLSGFKCIEKAEVIPFHKMGEYKWEGIGSEYTLKDTPAPTEEETEKARQIFASKGLKI